jgi:hypothetical protein
MLTLVIVLDADNHDRSGAFLDDLKDQAKLAIESHRSLDDFDFLSAFRNEVL